MIMLISFKNLEVKLNWYISVKFNLQEEVLLK